MTEERAECLRHREDELSMRQLEKNVVRQMLGKENRALSTAGWTQVEALAGKGPEVVVPTFRVGTTDSGHALEIVTARSEPVAELLDTLKAVPTVGGGVLLIVLGVEIGEMPLEDGMELVAPTGNVPIHRHRRDRDCRSHISLYGRNPLPALVERACSPRAT